MARDRISGPVAFGAALVGLATILFMGMTYSPPSYPAINNVLPLVFFLITALLLGTSFGSWFASPEKRIWLTRVLTMTLIVGLVVYLLVPCVWLSGGTVMAQTGWAWNPASRFRPGHGSSSVWFCPWLRSGCPEMFRVRLPVIILIGEFIGRMVFFKDTLHAAGNLGGLY